MIEAKAVRHSAPWMEDIIREVSFQLETEMEAAVQIAMEKSANKLRAPGPPAKVYFPHEWNSGDRRGDGIGGQLPVDALTLYVSLPFYDDCDEQPYWSFTINDAVDSFIELYGDRRGKLDEDGSKQAESFSAGLRAVADRLDAARS